MLQVQWVSVEMSKNSPFMLKSSEENQVVLVRVISKRQSAEWDACCSVVNSKIEGLIGMMSEEKFRNHSKSLTLLSWRGSDAQHLHVSSKEMS